MKTTRGYIFTAGDLLPKGNRNRITVGQTHKRRIKMDSLFAPTPLAALGKAYGNTCWCVKMSGTTRTYLWCVHAEGPLRRFVLKCQKDRPPPAPGADMSWTWCSDAHRAAWDISGAVRHITSELAYDAALSRGVNNDNAHHLGRAAWWEVFAKQNRRLVRMLGKERRKQAGNAFS